MKFVSELTYLGLEPKTSKKSGKDYYIAKLVDEDTQIFEMYVPETETYLLGQLRTLSMTDKVKAGFMVSSFQGKPQIDLKHAEKIEDEKKTKK